MKLELSFIQTLSNYWLSLNTAEMQFLHVEQSQYVAWTILIQLEHFIGLLIYKANIAQRQTYETRSLYFFILAIEG